MPFARHIPFSPQTFTLMGLLISILTAWIFAQGYLIMGAVFILITGAFDIIDGAVARATNRMTAFGGVLDSVCDRYADGIIYVGIIHGIITNKIIFDNFLFAPWLWCSFALIGSYLVSYIRARAEASHAKNMNIGIAERPERMIILTLGAVSGLLLPAIIIIAIITHITSFQRMIKAAISVR